MGRARRAGALLAFAAAFGIPGAAMAAPGDPDPSFGSSGSVDVSQALGAPVAVSAVAKDPVTGGYVIAGQYDPTGSAPSVLVARFTSAGKLDMSFNSGSTPGYYKLTVDASSLARAVAVASNGTIYWAGESDSSSGARRSLVGKLTNAGQPDSSFSESAFLRGFVLNQPESAKGYGSGYANAVAATPDGKVVIGGQASDGGTNQPAYVARFNADGSLDTGFAGTGYAMDFYTGGEVRALTVAADGSVVAAGSVADAFFVERYTAAGAFDHSFGTVDGGGYTEEGWGTAANAVALQSDGKIVVAGTNGNQESMVARFTASGLPDTGFNNNNTPGYSLMPFGSGSDYGTGPRDCAFTGVATGPNGTITVAGFEGYGPGALPGGMMARYDSAGGLDGSFGSNGVAPNGDGSHFYATYAGVLVDSTRAVAAGESEIDAFDDSAGGPRKNIPPVAKLTVDPQSIRPGDSVVFDASGSYDPDNGKVARYDWDFNGDGTIDHTSFGANGATLQYTYGDPVPDHATVTVTDDDGAAQTSANVYFHSLARSVHVVSAPQNESVFQGESVADIPITLSHTGDPGAVTATAPAGSGFTVTGFHQAANDPDKLYVTLQAAPDLAPGSHSATITFAPSPAGAGDKSDTVAITFDVKTGARIDKIDRNGDSSSKCTTGGLFLILDGTDLSQRGGLQWRVAVDGKVLQDFSNQEIFIRQFNGSGVATVVVTARNGDGATDSQTFQQPYGVGGSQYFGPLVVTPDFTPGACLQVKKTGADELLYGKAMIVDGMDFEASGKGQLVGMRLHGGHPQELSLYNTDLKPLGSGGKATASVENPHDHSQFFLLRSQPLDLKLSVGTTSATATPTLAAPLHASGKLPGGFALGDQFGPIAFQRSSQNYQGSFSLYSPLKAPLAGTATVTLPFAPGQGILLSRVRYDIGTPPSGQAHDAGAASDAAAQLLPQGGGQAANIGGLSISLDTSNGEFLGTGSINMGVGTLIVGPTPYNENGGLRFDKHGVLESIGATMDFCNEQPSPPCAGLAVGLGANLEHVSIDTQFKPFTLFQLEGAANWLNPAFDELDGKLFLGFPSHEAPWNAEYNFRGGQHYKHFENPVFGFGLTASFFGGVAHGGANGFFDYADRYFYADAEGDADLKVVEAGFSGEGWVSHDKYNLDAEMHASSDVLDDVAEVVTVGLAKHVELQVSAAFSSKGYGAWFSPAGVDVGGGYIYGKGLVGGFIDVGKLTETDPHEVTTAAVRAHAATLSSKPPFEALEVVGSGDVPHVTLTAPDGTSYPLPKLSRPLIIKHPHPIVFWPDAADHTLLIGIPRAQSGTWKITPTADSTPILHVMKADGRPAFKISGSVHGKGRTRTLTFSTNGQPGYSFDLSEAGKAVGQPLAVLRGRATGITATHGSLTFLPGDAPGAARSIQATIYHDGVPVRVQTLARFAAPPRVMPGRVAALSVKRARGGLQIRWRQATNCERYELKVKVKGRETFIFMPRASTTTQFIPGVTAPAGAKITIRGVHLGFRYGRTSTLILRPPAKKKPHRPSKPHKKRRHG